MAGMPYLLLAGVSVWVYRGLRRKAAADSQVAEPPAQGSGTSLRANDSDTSTSDAGAR
jgi:hypothetical protein